MNKPRRFRLTLGLHLADLVTGCSLLLLAGCTGRPSTDAKNEKWQSDLGAFRREVTAAIDKAAGPPVRDNFSSLVENQHQANDAVKPFVGKHVTWTLTFQGIDEKFGIQFKEDVPDKGVGETVGKTNALIIILLDEAHLAEWKKLKEGAQVTCRGRIGFIQNNTRNPGGWMIAVSVKDARPE